MLDIKLIIQDPHKIIKTLNRRPGDYSFVQEIVVLADARKTILQKTELLKARRNEIAAEIGKAKRQGIDTQDLMNESEGINAQILEFDTQIREYDVQLQQRLEVLPNLPDKSVPTGADESGNEVVKTYLEPTKFDFPVKDHVELGEKLGILDFKNAAKITGARFVIDKGLGAKLERSLIAFMLDTHVKKGYTEVIPPYVVSDKSMYATGQFPKFQDQAFHLEGTNYYLNPTAEVPIINMYRDEMLSLSDLPINHVGYTTAFRQEAGSAGRDTRGMIRQHQFNKVELIKLVTPESSMKELQIMLKEAERILQLLKLPYRVVNLCTGDLGFNAVKTFDIEVWIPSQNCYREISSVSNDGDFQSRRANIKFKRDKDSKPEFLHTLNGSGLAVGRTMIAILENYQQADGSILIPSVLVKYMGVKSIPWR
jgi:seryl-tRNA synthetase